MEKLEELPYINNAEIFSAELRRLYEERISRKKISKNYRKKISLNQRKEIFQKTLGTCHICGQKLNEAHFQIDHLFPYAIGGKCDEENFIPVCSLCNNYRWNYLPDEIKWIMKVGIWAKTQIEYETNIGKSIAKEFIEYEINRERRRKNKRKPLHIEKDKFPVRKKVDFTKFQKLKPKNDTTN